MDKIDNFHKGDDNYDLVRATAKQFLMFLRDIGAATYVITENDALVVKAHIKGWYVESIAGDEESLVKLEG